MVNAVKFLLPLFFFFISFHDASVPPLLKTRRGGNHVHTKHIHHTHTHTPAHWSPCVCCSSQIVVVVIVARRCQISGLPM